MTRFEELEPIVSSEESRQFDRHTIDEVGVPALALMETAGRAVADAVEQLGAGPVVVLAGVGNNGGDGFVAARTLRARGREVDVLVLGDDAALRGDPRACFSAASKAGVRVQFGADAAALRRVAGDAAILVDALFGTGLSRPLAGSAAALVEAMNALGRPIVAVDVPSGLDADRGVPLEVAVRATCTVTFAFKKRGLVGSPGFTYAGKVIRADIGIAQALAESVRVRLLDKRILEPFAHRDPLGHKGTHGHVLLVAGSVGKIGAALLSGRAALRAGAGLCTLATPTQAQARIEGHLPELMTLGYPGVEVATGASSTGFDAAHAIDALVPELTGKRVVAIGPGVPTAPAFAEVIERLVYGAVAESLPVVLDADALNHLVHRPSILDVRPGDGLVVLTPHPGEAARLLGKKVPEIEADRYAAALELAKRYSAVVALKGARTLIAAPDGRIGVCPAGGAILGAGGSGDVLTGAVAALIGNRSAPGFETVCAAVYLHATAADLAAERLPDRGLLASELADALPAALAFARA
jgi:ADP-dependent NAD(P)H-hydrate dehydratase / NAD(P)H-hydrate epimerase